MSRYRIVSTAMSMLKDLIDGLNCLYFIMKFFLLSPDIFLYN